MSETTHTSGPWRIGKAYGSVVADHPIPEIHGADEVDYYGGHLVAESIAPQNRLIIAAAPEMFGLLTELIDMEGPQPGNSAWGDKVLGLIARVTGKESA